MNRGMPRRAAMLVIAIVLLLAVAWWQRWSPTHPSRAVAPAHDMAAVARHPPSRPGPSTAATFDSIAAQDPEAARCEVDRQRQMQALRDRLQSPRTAEEAIAHALLSAMSVRHGPDADLAATGREYLAARRRWPDDLDLAWFSLQHCVDQRGCDRQAETRHLIAVDPDNAATWLEAMETARESRDDIAYDAALHRAAGAKFYDPRRGMTYLHLRPLLSMLPPPPSCLSPKNVAELEAALGRPAAAGDWADIFAMGMELATNMSGYPALAPCKRGPRPMPASRREDCIALLSWIADGDSFEDQSIGLSRLIPLVGNGAAGAPLRERYRQMRWLLAQPLRPAYPPGYAARVWSEGEIPTRRADAIEAGRWPPPADWLPEDARGRALIQGTQLPP